MFKKFMMFAFFTASIIIPLFGTTKLPKPFLFSLNGIYNHPISSKSPLAQAYFNQGMIFFYGYNYEESARSFQEAANLDPNCAICYWGRALALRGLENDGPSSLEIEGIHKAKSLMEHATAHEQSYINALANSYLSNRDSPKSLNQTFMNEMKKVSEQYPDDLDALTLYAKAEMDAKPVSEWDGAQKKLVNVLAKDPNHPGANHYYIHAVESSHPEDGLASAKKLEYLVPFAGHLLHMPAHIHYKMGDYHKATIANEKAIKADEDLFEKGGIKGLYFSSYYFHNLQFLIASLVMEGKRQEALQAAQKITDILKNEKPALSPYMENALSVQTLLILQRFNLETIIDRGFQQSFNLERAKDSWDQILREPKPGTQLGNGMWHYARSLVYLAKNDLEKAKIEAAAIPEERMEEKDLNMLLRIVFLNARAAIEEQEGNQAKMLQDYEEAITLENTITHFEPPLWFISSKEALGFAYLRMGRPTEAKKMFQEDLKRYPNKPWYKHENK